MHPNRLLFTGLALGSDTVTLRAPDFRIRLGERLAVVTPEQKQPSQAELCAVCGDLRDPAIGFCSGCGSRERVQAQDEQPDDPRIRLVHRVAHSLAAEAALHVESGLGPAGGAVLQESRLIYMRLGSQRRLLRERLLRAQTTEERELYQRVLQRVERVLRRGARR